MDEQLQRQLIRQLKIINFWISIYGAIFLVALGFIIFMIFQLVTFVQTTNDRIDQLKNSASDSVNIKKNSCENQGPFGELLRSKTEVCN